jgi:hypothetical protein
LGVFNLLVKILTMNFISFSETKFTGRWLVNGLSAGFSLPRKKEGQTALPQFGWTGSRWDLQAEARAR